MFSLIFRVSSLLISLCGQCFSPSFVNLGIMCKCVWNTACPAAFLVFIPMLNPSALTAFITAVAIFFVLVIMSFSVSSGVSSKSVWCSFGTTNVCPGFTGIMSKKATILSFS